MRKYPTERLIVDADTERGPILMSDTIAMVKALKDVVNDSAAVIGFATVFGRDDLAERNKRAHNRALCVLWRLLN